MDQIAPVFQMPFGSGRLAVQARASLIEAPWGAPIADETGAIEAALAHPIGSKPLWEIARSGERVAIMVNDITRLARTDLMLPPVVKALNDSGVPDRDIFVVFALGIHRLQTDAERELIVGPEMARRLRMFDHVAADNAGLVEIGVTRFGNRVEINREVWEADRIVLTGEIVYHLIAGYSGGRKSLVPGVAGARTTTFNHRMIFDPNCRPGKLEGNPAHEDLLEAARMAEPDFLLNVILSPEGRLLGVVAGDFEAAHREGCKLVDRMLRVQVDGLFDGMIGSAGGFPLDIDLRQAHKGLENACLALRPGGFVVFYAECPKGAGSPAFEDYVNRYRDEYEMRTALEREFVVGGHKAYWIARLARKYRIHLVSALNPEFVRRCGFTPVSAECHQECVDELIRAAGPDARIAAIPHAGFTLPSVGGSLPPAE